MHAAAKWSPSGWQRDQRADVVDVVAAAAAARDTNIRHGRLMERARPSPSSAGRRRSGQNVCPHSANTPSPKKICSAATLLPEWMCGRVEDRPAHFLRQRDPAAPRRGVFQTWLVSGNLLQNPPVGLLGRSIRPVGRSDAILSRGRPSGCEVLQYSQQLLAGTEVFSSLQVAPRAQRQNIHTDPDPARHSERRAFPTTAESVGQVPRESTFSAPAARPGRGRRC